MSHTPAASRNCPASPFATTAEQVEFRAEDMIADIFTKATDKATFIRLRNVMMNIHGPLMGPLRAALEKSFKASTGVLRRMIGSVYGTVYDALIHHE